MLTSIGIDPSTAATGVVMLESNPKGHPTLLLEEIIAHKKLTGIKRNVAICQDLLEIIVDRKPDRIVIEGYSLNLRNAKSVIPLVELGGLFRFLLQLDGYAWYAPRASELKKFVTGKGTGDKAAMMMHVLKRWEHVSKSNDTADAYGLACMGLAHANQLMGVTQSMRQITGQMVKVTN